LSAFDQTHRFLLEFVRVTRTIRFVRHLILLALITSHRKGYVFRGQGQRTGNLKIVGLGCPVFQPDICDLRYSFTIPVPLEQQLAVFLEQDGVVPPLRRPERMPRRGCEPLARGQGVFTLILNRY
jgi:hypothetical protein